jgi:hypothetical protein
MTTFNHMEGKDTPVHLRRTTADANHNHEHTAPAHPLLTLQRHVGNTTIARMIAQRDENLDKEEEEQPGAIQATHDATLQRQGTPDEEADDSTIQAKPEVGLEGGPVSDGLAQRINAQRGSGAPLGDSQRAQMESSLSTPLDDVRIHQNDESDALNRSISAKAFTTGSDIFFRKDASPNDTGLLAHELTHVVQQRSMSGGGPLTVGSAGDAYEQQADATAQAITSGTATNGPGTSLGANGAEGVQREAVPEKEEEQV